MYISFIPMRQDSINTGKKANANWDATVNSNNLGGGGGLLINMCIYEAGESKSWN